MLDKIIIWSIFLVLFTTITNAQKGFFVPQRAKIFFNGNNATIFSDVINSGQLGIGKGATLNFKGIKWENNSQSIITDESNNGNGYTGEGGIVRFLSPEFYYQPQLLLGGYNSAIHNGPVFANLYIENKNGVTLTDGSTKIRNRLHFTEGHIYTNDQVLVIGDGNPGIISGYNENNFVVTGLSGGILLREKMTFNDGSVIFPIGAADGLYTPASIRTGANVPDDFYARVFNGVAGGVPNGRNLNDKSVNKTWQIGKLLRPNEDAVEITLQHLVAEEGQVFNRNRSKAYLSQYTNGQWDIGFPQRLPVTYSIFSPGSLATKWGANSRNFKTSIGIESYFTKFTKELPGPTIDFRIWPNPTPDIFYISIGQNDGLPAHTIIVWNIIGQKIREEKLNGRPVIEMRGLIPGTYIVGLISNIGVVIEAKKLLVVGY